VVACVLFSFSLRTSEAVAAAGSPATLSAPASDDVAAYIMRVGGWESPIIIEGDTANRYWTQVSYAVSDKPASPNQLTTSTLLILTVTRSILMRSTPGQGAAPPCSMGETITETITFDPRDISVKDISETSVVAPPPNTTDPTKPRSVPALWEVNFSVYKSASDRKPRIIRQSTTVTAPACTNPSSLVSVDTSPIVSDMNVFSIEFADKDQADYLITLANAAWTDSPWPPPRVSK